MTLSEIKLLKEIPQNVSPLIQAMWHDHHGDWEASHTIAQDIITPDGSWVHAYLHRKEGDRSNAQYWYNKAGRNMCTLSFEKEWEEIMNALLKKEVTIQQIFH